MKTTERMLIIIFLGFSLLILTFSNTLDFKEEHSKSQLSPNPSNLKLIYDIYFVDGNLLKTEQRELPYSQGDFLKSVAEELMRGPKHLEYGSVFEPNNKLISITRDNYTCKINLSSDFLDNPFWKNPKSELYLWSVVNTLTELDNIYDVQFLVEGKIINRSIDTFDMSKPLPRIEEYNFKKKTYPSDIVLKFIDGINSGRFDISYDLIDSESQKEYDFDKFTKIFSDYSNRFGEHTKDLHFIQDYEDYWLVIIKYKPSTPGSSVIYDTWKVVLEGSTMKINLIDRFKSSESNRKERKYE